MAGFRMWGVTDTGRQRTRNEDAIAWDEARSYAVLADGVGGQNAGDVASRLVVSVLESRLRTACDGKATDVLAAAVREANALIHTQSQSNPAYAGMGSTVVAVLFMPSEAIVAHVGDSRLYRLRAGSLDALTVDHSLVQELVSEGFLTPEEARASGHRHVITRALGSAPEVTVEVCRFDVRPGDRLLLCSDGLSDMVDEDVIATLLSRRAPPEAIALDLVACANDNGGQDNISAIVIQVV